MLCQLLYYSEMQRLVDAGDIDDIVATAAVRNRALGVTGALIARSGYASRRHAEILTPAIEFVCKQADVELDELGCVAVDVGPGLFTGMRVGLAAAKALALALRIPMIGISSLDLLSFPVRHTGTTTRSVLVETCSSTERPRTDTMVWPPGRNMSLIDSAASRTAGSSSSSVIEETASWPR